MTPPPPPLMPDEFRRRWRPGLGLCDLDPALCRWLRSERAIARGGIIVAWLTVALGAVAVAAAWMMAHALS